MDKLTLIIVAENDPACVIEDDGDTWHASCFVSWIEGSGSSQNNLRWLSNARIVEPDTLAICYMSKTFGLTCQHEGE
jgi:hypothetical protein